MRLVPVLLIIFSMLGASFTANAHLLHAEQDYHKGLHLHVSEAGPHFADTGYDQPDSHNGEHIHFSLIALLYNAHPVQASCCHSHDSVYRLSLTSLHYTPLLPPPDRSLSFRV